MWKYRRSVMTRNPEASRHHSPLTPPSRLSIRTERKEVGDLPSKDASQYPRGGNLSSSRHVQWHLVSDGSPRQAEFSCCMYYCTKIPPRTRDTSPFISTVFLLWNLIRRLPIRRRRLSHSVFMRFVYSDLRVCVTSGVSAIIIIIRI